MRERSGLFHLLLTAAGALVFSLIVAAALASSIAESAAWRGGCGLLGAYGFFGASRAALEEFRGEHSLPPFFAWPLPIGGLLLAVANLLAAAGPLSDLAPLAFVALLIWCLFVSLVYFVSLLITDPGRAA
jgi:hypothetical protein